VTAGDPSLPGVNGQVKARYDLAETKGKVYAVQARRPKEADMTGDQPKTPEPGNDDKDEILKMLKAGGFATEQTLQKRVRAETEDVEPKPAAQDQP